MPRITLKSVGFKIIQAERAWREGREADFWQLVDELRQIARTVGLSGQTLWSQDIWVEAMCLGMNVEGANHYSRRARAWVKGEPYVQKVTA